MAAVVVGGWDPLRTALACLVFGAADAAQLRFQAMDLSSSLSVSADVTYLATVNSYTMVKYSVSRNMVQLTINEIFDITVMGHYAVVFLSKFNSEFTETGEYRVFSTCN